MSQRKILLLEPNYKNKYPPMGLMKIATYHRCRHDDVRFYKGDMKEFSARLIFEEYFSSLDSKHIADRVVSNFVRKQGASSIIEFIKTGKHAPLKTVAAFSRSWGEPDERMLEILLKHFSVLRDRYKKEDFPKFDRVCITTLFTFYWKETLETILFAKKLCKADKNVYVGGIASSLVPEYIEKETGIKPYIGLLDRPYIYDRDRKGNVIIDDLPLDYSILGEIDYTYPTADAYFAYMTRGCVNRCDFCAVPKLEPMYCDYIGIKAKIQKVENCFGARRDLLLMDNNVFASKSFDPIIDEIMDCGFSKGAMYIPPNEYDIAYRNFIKGFQLSNNKTSAVFNDRAYARMIINIYDKIAERLPPAEKGDFYNKRESSGLLFAETVEKTAVVAFHALAKAFYDKYFKKKERIRVVDFNQGLDGRLATDKKMRKIARTAIRPLRIAFDHWSMRNVYEKAVRTAVKYGISDLSNYLLYNFRDHPDELYERLRLNIDLCEELDVAIYSFPMKFHPIDDPDYFRNRDYIGKPYWNEKFVRAIQAVLNSTHGKIGRGVTFFEAAFGQDLNEFHKILWMPEALIIQRYKYDKQKRIEYYGDASSPYDKVDEATGNITSDWWNKFQSLGATQREQAEHIIAAHRFRDSDINVSDRMVRAVLQFYKIKRDEV